MKGERKGNEVKLSSNHIYNGVP